MKKNLTFKITLITLGNWWLNMCKVIDIEEYKDKKFREIWESFVLPEHKDMEIDSDELLKECREFLESHK